MRSYGWKDGKVVDAEAVELRGMAQRIVDGVPMKHIIADLKERGVLTVTGKTSWAPRTISRALQAPRIIGKKIVDGVLVDDPEARAILDVDVWEEVVAVFEDPERVKFRSPRRRESLLSGVLHCALCDGRMYALGPNYGCGDCARVHIRQDAADADVAEQVLVRVTSDVWLRMLRDAVDAGPEFFAGEVAEADERLAVIAAEFGGVGDRAAFDAGVAEARGARARAERRAAFAGLVSIEELSTPSGVVEWWTDVATVADRRVVIAVVVDRVVVRPRGADERVQVVWRALD